MQDIADSHTLLLFPCCSSKLPGGVSWREPGSRLNRFVSENVVREVMIAREELLKIVQSTKEHEKNMYIKYGPDFNGTDFTGKYLPAIERYSLGFLYKEIPELLELIERRLLKPDAPRMLILSALYGPLYPLDMIQDYDLKMNDLSAIMEWKKKKTFSRFLKEYIKINRIERVELFFGHSTEYLKVARDAVKPLLKDGALKDVVQYKVENGNTQATLKAHGRMLASRLNASIKTDVVILSKQPLADNWVLVIIR